MKKILILCAMEMEQKSIKEYYQGHSGTLPYRADFVLSGLGRAKAVSALVQSLSQQKYDLVINVGTCGIKVKNEKTEYAVGCLMEPFEVYDGDFCFGGEVRKIPLNPKNPKSPLPLVTISAFGRYDAAMHQSYIEDMEGFEIANVCQALHQPFRLMKIISNHITNQPEKDIQEFYENYEKVIRLNTEKILNKVQAFLSGRKYMDE